MKFEWEAEGVGTFTNDETVVGRIHWFEDQWTYSSGPGDPPAHGNVYIEVDGEAEAGFRAERAAIAEQPEAVRDALNAELDGRLHAFMLDTKYLARAKGMILARRQPGIEHLRGEVERLWDSGVNQQKIADRLDLRFMEVVNLLNKTGRGDQPAPNERT